MAAANGPKNPLTAQNAVAQKDISCQEQLKAPGFQAESRALEQPSPRTAHPANLGVFQANSK
jgi:hypothetical protein